MRLVWASPRPTHSARRWRFESLLQKGFGLLRNHPLHRRKPGSARLACETLQKLATERRQGFFSNVSARAETIGTPRTVDVGSDSENTRFGGAEMAELLGHREFSQRLGVSRDNWHASHGSATKYCSPRRPKCRSLREPVFGRLGSLYFCCVGSALSSATPPLGRLSLDSSPCGTNGSALLRRTWFVPKRARCLTACLRQRSVLSPRGGRDEHDHREQLEPAEQHIDH